MVLQTISETDTLATPLPPRLVILRSSRHQTDDLCFHGKGMVSQFRTCLHGCHCSQRHSDAGRSQSPHLQNCRIKTDTTSGDDQDPSQSDSQSEDYARVYSLLSRKAAQDAKVIPESRLSTYRNLPEIRVGEDQAHESHLKAHNEAVTCALHLIFSPAQVLHAIEAYL